MLSSKLHSSIGNTDRLYVDDVFSTYLYTGNGSTQTINNGIDLAGKGGMVWTKYRIGATDHALYDTARGATLDLVSNSSAGQITQSTGLTTFKNSGFSVGSLAKLNTNSSTYASWTFRKAPKFFDVVTYTGNGASSRTIAHSLGVAPGMIVVKRTDGVTGWMVYHRSVTAGSYLRLETAAELYASTPTWTLTPPSSSSFYVGDDTWTNASGGTYVAYLFAHDPSADGFIQCGSYTGNGSTTGPIVNLGWEPQYLMIKNASGTGDWQIIDSMRGMPVGSADATLQANLPNAESSVDYISPTATGFQITSTSSEVNTSGSNYIYLAIRRPNKPPTTGTGVYNAIARTGTGAAATVTGVGFAPDLVVSKDRSGAARGAAWFDRLRGATKQIVSDTTGSEIAATDALTTFLMDGYTVDADTVAANGINESTATYINHFFKRAPGVFDVVCYTGNNTYGGDFDTHFHSLGVMPELIIVKARTTTTNNGWGVIYTNGVVPFSNSSGQTMGIGRLNSTAMQLTTNYTVTTLTTTKFQFSRPQITGTSDRWFDELGKSYVAFLFASCPGISKVGRYTGNGATQTINCGFTTGARFILIKRTDSTGDWYVWDTARGIVSANDPHLSLNTEVAEVTTDDSVDPEASGFIVNQVAATNVNVTGATYIFLAVS